MKARLAHLKASVLARTAAARARSERIDHLFRAKTRYDDVRGDRHAGAVTYFGFLSLFPLLALVFAIIGYLIGWYPGLYADVARGISDALPGLVGNEPGQVNIDQIASAKAGAGLFGLAGLFLAGTAWVDALRESLRSMWLQSPVLRVNVVRRKALDGVVLVLLGSAMLASLALSSVATVATGAAVDLLALPDGTVSVILVRVVAIAVAVAGSALLLAVMFWRLSGMHLPRRRLIHGAVIGGVAFEALKLSATFLLGNTMRNPVYATFAVAVGALVWINFVTRATLLAAAWTATEPYSDAAVGKPRLRTDSRGPADEVVLDSEAVPDDGEREEPAAPPAVRWSVVKGRRRPENAPAAQR
ncbi:MAG: YihY/virulence factor BrkB family protein [Sporichthyaceae bacterium]